MKKKIVSLVLICTMLLGILAVLPVSAESAPNNYHQSLKVHALEGTPTVDGIVDDIWADAEVDTLEYLIAGDGQLKDPTAEQVAAECGVQYRVMWDENKIYFLVEIHDDELSPDFFTPDDPTSNGAQWWKTDALFMYVSETGLHTGYSAGNSYQLVLPLTKDYYETAVIRKGEKETGHPVKDGALTRKTVVNGGDVVIELSLELREENVAKNHIGQTMSVTFQYHDVDASSDYAKAYTESGSNPRTLCVCSSNRSPDIEGSGRNNWVGIKLTKDYEVLKGTPVLDGVIDDVWADAAKAELGNIVASTSESLNPTLTDSSSAYAKVIYDDNKVYMLMVAEDDDFYTGSDTEWKNDSFIIKLGEQQDWFAGEIKGNDGDGAITYASTNTYILAARFDEKGAFVRANKGNALTLDYDYTVTGNENDGYVLVAELAIEFNVLENKAGNVFYTEFQYNDANPTYDAANNNRDLVRNWISGEMGLTTSNGLAVMKMSETEATLPDPDPEPDPEPAKRLSTDKTSYEVGESIKVTAIGQGTDWVGIYYPDEAHSIYWAYIDAANGGAGSGVEFDMVADGVANSNDVPAVLPAGTYIIRLMPNDSTNVEDALETIEIVITEADQGGDDDTEEEKPATGDMTLALAVAAGLAVLGMGVTVLARKKFN